MNEQTAAGPGASPADETKRSVTIRSRDGRGVRLTRGVADGLNALTVSADLKGGASLTAYVHDFDLKLLFDNGNGDCCLTCRFSRLDPDGRRLRCHVGAPRVKQSAPAFREMSRSDWCGRFKPMVQAAPAVAP